MAKTKRTWLIAGSVVVIGGVVGYFVWKWIKGKKSDIPSTDGTTTPQPTQSGSGSSTDSANRPTTANQITAFQIYAKGKGADLGSSGKNKDGIDGVWGGKTETAWQKYKDEYNKSLKAIENTKDNQTLLDRNYSKSVSAIDYLVGGGDISGKTLIESGKGKYFNMAGKELGTLRTKGYAFGKAESSKPFSVPNKPNEHQITFIGNNGVRYYTYASMCRVFIG